MNDLKKWYNNLYRGEKYAVNILGIMFAFILVIWVTHDFSDRKHPKYIILSPK